MPNEGVLTVSHSNAYLYRFVIVAAAAAAATAVVIDAVAAAAVIVHNISVCFFFVVFIRKMFRRLPFVHAIEK